MGKVSRPIWGGQIAVGGGNEGEGDDEWTILTKPPFVLDHCGRADTANTGGMKSQAWSFGEDVAKLKNVAKLRKRFDLLQTAHGTLISFQKILIWFFVCAKYFIPHFLMPQVRASCGLVQPNVKCS